MNVQLLNAVQRLLIDCANRNDINLAAEFDGPADFKRFVVGYTYRALRDSGMDPENAFDEIFGDGSYMVLFARFSSNSNPSNTTP
jgi:hypothetical protein